MKASKHLTIVIKLGTSSIVHEKTHEPRLSVLGLIVETAVNLRRDGYHVVIVSSGAIGVALQMMNLEKRPKHLPAVQALAALGQCRLMSLWDQLFRNLQQPVAQVLLTRNDIADRTQCLNARNTLFELLNMGVIPIVNENDTLSVAEIKFGDNDTLSAITAGLIHADYLFLMTDVDCLYTANPRIDPNASPIEVVADIAALSADVSKAGSALGTGGMGTKITAAKLATSAGVMTIITRSSEPQNIFKIMSYLQALRETADEANPAGDKGSDRTNLLMKDIPLPPLHTRFIPSATRIGDRSFWLLHGLAPHGTIYIDYGAHKALISTAAGLLPAGVVAVEGNFGQQEAVRLVVVKRLPRPRSGVNTPLSESGSALSTAAPSQSQSGTEISSNDSAVPARFGGLAGYEASTDINDPVAMMSASITSLSSHDTTSQDLVSSGGDLYEKVEPPPREIGRALVNYSAVEVAKIMGRNSGDIVNILGYADSEHVAWRDNIALIDKGPRKPDTALYGDEHKNSKIGTLGSFESK